MSADLSSGQLSPAWEGIGAGGSVELEAVELWRVQLPFVRPVATAKGVHRSRPLVLVKVVGRTDASGGRVEGWGECAALADATYDREDVNGSFRALRDELVPALFDLARRTGTARVGARLPPPSDLGPIRESAPHAPLAFAALEMAVADAHLRAEHRSLADCSASGIGRSSWGRWWDRPTRSRPWWRRPASWPSQRVPPAQDEDRDELGHDARSRR